VGTSTKVQEQEGLEAVARAVTHAGREKTNVCSGGIQFDEEVVVKNVFSNDRLRGFW
jgi:hypothetical protein